MITNVFMSVKVFHKQTEVNIIKYRSLTQVFDSEKKTYNSTTIKIQHAKIIPPPPKKCNQKPSGTNIRAKTSD